jgi:hypothetical protein
MPGTSTSILDTITNLMMSDIGQRLLGQTYLSSSLAPPTGPGGGWSVKMPTIPASPTIPTLGLASKRAMLNANAPLRGFMSTVVSKPMKFDVRGMSHKSVLFPGIGGQNA